MKSILKLSAAIILLSLTSCYVNRAAYQSPPPPPPSTYATAPQTPPPPTTPVYSESPQQTYPTTPEQSSSYQTFYDNLSPYGQWINSPEYGYIWRPDADGDPDFQPYGNNGYWEMTNYGWTWNSNYQWGWAAFHYGRWILDPMYGWMWIPGNNWGPAWVSWRQSGDYYGWAPMGPNMSVDVNYENGYNIPSNYWVFVNRRNMCDHDIYHYYAPRGQNEMIYHNSMFINNRTNGYDIDHNDHHYYPSGPRITEVEASTGRVITPLTISQGSHPNEGASINNGHMNIYHPTIVESPKNNNRSDEHTPTPRRITPMSNLKPISHPDNNNQPEHPSNVEPQRPNNNQPEHPSNVEPQRPNNNQPEHPSNVEPQRPSNAQPQHTGNAHPQKPNRANKVPQQKNKSPKPVNHPKPQKTEQQRKEAPTRIN